MADPKGSDFNIRKPIAPAAPLSTGQNQLGAPQPAPGQPHPATSGSTQQAMPLVDSSTDGLSSNNTIIGVAVVLALALLFFFLRGGLRSHLIAHRASPSAAGSAGWSLFAFLLVVSITVVFGILGNLWQVLAFLIPMGVLVVVTLAVFGMLYRSAARGRQ